MTNANLKVNRPFDKRPERCEDSKIINYHDRGAINKKMEEAAMKAAGPMPMLGYDVHRWQAHYQSILGKAIQAANRKYLRHIGQLSKYMPYQGQQECARRCKQIGV